MLLKELCDTIAVSGYENNIADYIQSMFSSFNAFTLQKSNIGNLIYHKPSISNNVKIMIIAHMDEVGCQITNKIAPYCYEFKVLGSIKAWNLTNQRIKFENGALGMICLKQEKSLTIKEFDNLYVYTFTDNITIGDTFTFCNQFVETQESFISKSLDNRISIYGILEALSELNIENIVDDLFIVFTVQEEIGMRGAKVAISSIKPDIIINIDASAIGEKNNIIIGGGVAVKISDSIGVSDRYLVRKIMLLAKQNNILLQPEVSDCGTSELIMVNESDEGSRTVGISIPCQSIHTANTIVNKLDYHAYKKLLKTLLVNLNNIVG